MTWIDTDGQPCPAFNHQRNFKKATESLLGICKGLLADQELNEREIIYLDAWLKDNEIATQGWPGNSIAERVCAVLADGIITAEEADDLAATLSAICGIDLEQGIVSGLSTRSVAGPVDKVIFDGRTFCFTGKFIYGPRQRLVSEIEKRGGLTQGRVTKDLNYLVIGALASRDWAHTSHGRKIEAAIHHRDSGCSVVILDEGQWAEYL